MVTQSSKLPLLKMMNSSKRRIGVGVANVEEDSAWYAVLEANFQRLTSSRRPWCLEDSRLGCDGCQNAFIPEEEADSAAIRDREKLSRLRLHFVRGAVFNFLWPVIL